MAKDNKGGSVTMDPPESTSISMPTEQTSSGFLPPVKPVLKFRLDDGQHVGWNSRGEERLWNKGEIVECYKKPVEGQPLIPIDLAKRFNQYQAIKFTAVPADTPTSKGYKVIDGNPVMDDEDMEKFEAAEARRLKKAEVRLDGTDDVFDAMDLNALKAYANENEIDLGNAVSREAILTMIRQYENFMKTH